MLNFCALVSMSDSCFVDSETKPIIAADNHGLECLRRRQCHLCKWVPFIVVVVVVVVYNKGLQKSCETTRDSDAQGPVARSMVSVIQRLIPWQRIGFDTA